jgi:hypothetical protein
VLAGATRDTLTSLLSGRQQLGKALRFNGPARDRFVAGMDEHLDDPDRLKASLLPIRELEVNRVAPLPVPALHREHHTTVHAIG